MDQMKTRNGEKPESHKRWGVGLKAYNANDPKGQFHRRFRWKMLTRVLIHFIRWASLKTSGKDRGFVMRRIVAGRVQERIFDVEHFSKFVQQHQILTTHAKLLLFKEPQYRCNHDLVIILGCMNRMKCFNKYSVCLKRQLASKIRYNCYEKGTYIFKEGEPPKFFYFVLSGSVQFTEELDPALKLTSPRTQSSGKQTNTGKLMKEGEGFGELAIVNNKPRRGTIIATEHCECFTLEKEDFIEILGAYHEEERAMKFNVIKRIPQIEGVPEADIKRAMHSCYIKTFVKGEIIIKGEDHCIARNDTKEQLNSTICCLDTYAHVVVSGSTVLEKKIMVNEEPLPCGTTIVNIAKSSGEEVTGKDSDALLSSVTQRVRESIAMDQPAVLNHLTAPPPPPTFATSKYLSVKTYVAGDVFLPFIYEEDYVIGAKEPTTILFLPKTPFMLHKSGEKMVKLFEELANSKIILNSLLKEYNCGRIWKDYRKQLVRHVLVDKMLRKPDRCS